MAILQVIDGRERDLGGFVVRRVLPFEGWQMVGPFIFFDHLGPARFPIGAGIDVRPHPHVALATVSYLFEGSLEHRDSLGSVREILPGDVNWMTAGHGIAHSERTPRDARSSGARVHGIQSWVALPDGHEDVEPEFAHYPASMLPSAASSGVKLTVIVGDAYGMRSPVVTLWPTFYVHAELRSTAALELPSGYTERAVYVVRGQIEIGTIKIGDGQMTILDTQPATLRAVGDATLMLLGGERFPTARFLWWNFVASSRQRIDAAKARWAEQRFPLVPGETEFTPLPRL